MLKEEKHLIIVKLIIKLIKMIYINNLKNKIIVEKNNNKNVIKIFILYEFFALILSLISGIFLKSEYIIYIFAFYTGIIILGNIVTIFSYDANEKLEIAEEYIVIRFYAWKLPIYKAVLKNDENLKISYDEKMKGSIKFIFKLNYSIFYPGIYRLVKFESNGFKYSFGYDLERSDYQKIKELILEQRKINIF